MTDLPSYPEEAAEREEAQRPSGGDRHFSGWWRRVGAYLLDTLIILVPLVLVIIVFAALDVWAIVVIAYIATLAAPFVYFTFFHGDPRGQTPGKRMLGIRVMGDETGSSIGYGRSFGRYAITAVFGFFVIPVILDYLWPLWDSKNQALHDKVVGSVVLRGG